MTYTIVAAQRGSEQSDGRDGGRHLPGRAYAATWTCVGAGGGTCTASGAGNINDAVNLPVGARVTYHGDSRAISRQRPARSRTRRRSRRRPASPIRTPGNNSATDTDTMTPTGRSAITKTDGVATVTPGDSVTYTIVAIERRAEHGDRRDGGGHIAGRADRCDVDVRRSRRRHVPGVRRRQHQRRASICRSAGR